MDDIKTDVVVIGSGIGGMCAAALLAHCGIKTVVLENLAFAGGRYTCLEFEGFKIPTGGHMVNHGMDDPILKTMQEVDAPEVQFTELNVPTKYRINGEYQMLQGKGGLKKVVAAAARDDAECDRFMRGLYNAFKGDVPSDDITVRDWMLQHTDNEKILNIFQSQATALTGAPIQEFPAGEYIRVLGNFARLRHPLVPKNTGKSIIDALNKAFEEKNGKVLHTTRATKILVEKGAARGVIAGRNGRQIRIEAQTVICNAGPRKTVALTGEEHFDASYLKLISERLKPTPAMHFTLVSDKLLLDSLLFTTDTRRPQCWAPSSLICPEEAPEGKHLFTAFAAPPFGVDFNPAHECEVFLQDLNDVFPDFRDSGGQILLSRRFCGEWPYMRSVQGRDLPQETPVEQLYNVGDGVKPSGWIGASGAALSGRRVAEEVIKKLG